MAAAVITRIIMAQETPFFLSCFKVCLATQQRSRNLMRLNLLIQVINLLLCEPRLDGSRTLRLKVIFLRLFGRRSSTARSSLFSSKVVMPMEICVFSSD